MSLFMFHTKTRQFVRFIEPVHRGGRTDFVLRLFYTRVIFKNKEDRKAICNGKEKNSISFRNLWNLCFLQNAVK